MTLKELEEKQTRLLYNILSLFEQEDMNPNLLELQKLVYFQPDGEEKAGWQLSMTYTKVEGLESTELTLKVVKAI